MANVTIEAKTRNKKTTGADVLRAQGIVPAIMYGFGTEPVQVAVDRNIMNKAYEKAGESSVVDLALDGVAHPVLIQALQRDPVTDFITHADFRRVDLTKKVEAAIHLELVGISAAVKDLGGTLVQSLEEIEVAALPNALVPEIEVDISSLTTFDSVIRVGDLHIPEGIEVLSAITQTVALVQEPRSEAEMSALNEEIEDPIAALRAKEEAEAAQAEKAEAEKPNEKEK